MYRDTAIGINEGESYIGTTVNEGYVICSDLDPAGINGDHLEYFYYTDSYNDASIRAVDLHSRLMNSNIPANTCLIEDPILLSENHKYLIFIAEAFGHYILNTLSVMFSIYEKDKDAIFVFFTGTNDPSLDVLEKSHRGKLLEFLAEVCDKNKIPYYFLKSNVVPFNYKHVNYKSSVYDKTSTSSEINDLEVTYLIYSVNNVTIVNGTMSTSNLSVRDVKTYIDKYIIQMLGGYPESTKKIYITRANYKADPQPYYLDENSKIAAYKSIWDRIYQEDLVEKYLEDQGFESFQIERLDSIKDQIKLMMSTSVLISPSGSGLTNCLFMPDNGLMIELRVEIGAKEGSHRLTKEYFDFSAAKQHMYLAIDVPDKQGETAVKRLRRLLSNVDLDGFATGS